MIFADIISIVKQYLVRIFNFKLLSLSTIFADIIRIVKQLRFRPDVNSSNTLPVVVSNTIRTRNKCKPILDLHSENFP